MGREGSVQSSGDRPQSGIRSTARNQVAPRAEAGGELRWAAITLGALVLACASGHSASLAKGAVDARPAGGSGQVAVPPRSSPPLRALPKSELKRLISGRSVTSPANVPSQPDTELVEYFYEGGRYVGHRHGREYLGAYFFQGDALCVRTSQRAPACRIAIIDSERRLWLVRSLDPASFSESRIGNIPR